MGSVMEAGDSFAPRAASVRGSPRKTIPYPLTKHATASGLMPFALPRLLDPVVAAWTGTDPGVSLSVLAPLGWVGGAGAVLLVAIAAGCAWARARMRRGPLGRTVTWDCGYAAPTARMQYTASSFAQTIVESFSWVLLPRRKVPDIRGPFPKPAAFHSDVPDVVLDRGLAPAWGRAEETAGRLRVIQQGVTQVYVLYILATVVALFFWR